MANQKETLLSVGLNDLEAEVYLALLHEELLTGYKIGKLLGKPTANVYKALDSLAKKGAIMIEDQEKGLCKAVPASEFFAIIEAELKRKTQEAKTLFSQPAKESYDEKTYQLRSVDLVLEKCRQMLASCKRLAVIDVFPEPLKVLLPAIQEAVSRRVEVQLQVYEPVEIPGAHIILPQHVLNVLPYWKSQQLNMVVDGKEYVLALFNTALTEVYQATWSRNLYLSCLLHKGTTNEITISKIAAVLPEPNALELIKAIIQKQSLLSSGQVPGVEELLQRFGLNE